MLSPERFGLNYKAAFAATSVKGLTFSSLRPLEKKLFVSCNGPGKNRVGRSVKFSFFALFFWSKMCVLCMFYVDLKLGEFKKFRVGIFGIKTC